MYQYDKRGPKRGVALYSYSADFGLSKTLEDCFEDLYDMGFLIRRLSGSCRNMVMKAIC